MEHSQFENIWQTVFVEFVVFLKKGILREGPIFQESKKAKIYEAYQINRDKFRENKRDKSHLLDRHKISSALTHSILTVAPYPLLSGSHYTLAQRCANEIFASRVALQVLRNFNIQRASDATTREIFRSKYIFPETNNQEHYIIHLMKTLRQIRISGDSSLSALAHCFFLIEAFHLEKARQKHRQDIP